MYTKELFEQDRRWFGNALKELVQWDAAAIDKWTSQYAKYVGTDNVVIVSTPRHEMLIYDLLLPFKERAHALKEKGFEWNHIVTKLYDAFLPSRERGAFTAIYAEDYDWGAARARIEAVLNTIDLSLDDYKPRA